MPRPTQTDVFRWVELRHPSRIAPEWRALKFAEEAGEAVRAVNKWCEGRGSIEDIRLETAQTVITAMALAESLNFDLDEAIEEEWTRKAQKMEALVDA